MNKVLRSMGLGAAAGLLLLVAPTAAHAQTSTGNGSAGSRAAVPHDLGVVITGGPGVVIGGPGVIVIGL